ncbi:hypothetical protein LR48_Vigan11g054500 [Vigna angularis]|uniref:Uncharacterized protein n=1 Tax=Phaseolus angularis TaxID=3914 RepID=A0A0L9VRN2_PHAAN|nr:hypothetical protein LR48_Vigan11g054500 [Vigna angularis]
MAESSKRQRVRGSSSTGGGRRRRQPSPPQNSLPPSPPPSPTAEHHTVQFSTPAQAQRHWMISGAVIQSFGLIRNADNRWVHRNSPPPEPPPNPTPQLFIPPPPPPRSRFDEVMTGINDLRTFVGDSFNTLNETMNARFEQLELNMGDRFDTIDARVENVEHDI